MSRRYPDRPGTLLSLAQKEEDAVARLKKRLITDKAPTTRDATGSWVDWQAMSSVLGQPFDSTRIPLSKLEQMRRDPMIAFGLMFIKVPLIRAPWYIKSTDPKRASFIDNALRRIYGRFILGYTNCLDFGYSAMVKRFEHDSPDWVYHDKDEEDPDKMEKLVWDNGNVKALVWKPFMPLHPRKARPAWAESGEFNGILHQADKEHGTFNFEKRPKPDIPLEWSLWATNDKDSVFGSLFGYPRTGHAYRYWWSYWYRFGLADRAFEKWADPPILVFHPADIGVDDEGRAINFTSEALDIAEKVRSGANVAMPSSAVEGLDGKVTNIREWEIGQLESKANFDALNQSFEQLDVLRLRAIMVPEQALIEGKGGTSSRNVAATNMDSFQESQAVLMEQIDNHLNEWVIPQLLEMNFGPGGPSCTKVTTGFDTKDIETARAVIQGLANSDARQLPVDFRALCKELGLPLLSPVEFEKQLIKAAEEAAAMLPAKIESSSGTSGQSGTTQKGLYYAPRERIVVLRDKQDENFDLAEKLDSITDKVVELATRDMPTPEVKIDLQPQLTLELPETPTETLSEEKPARKVIGEKFLRDEEGNLVGKEFIYEEESDAEEA